MKSVAAVLQSKGDHTVYTISPSASVLDAITLMAEKKVGALLVVDDSVEAGASAGTQGPKIIGIITERDYARRVILKGRSSKDTPVRDVMTPHVMYVRPDQTNEECMALMTDNRLRHLPVMDNGKLVGLISIGDLVKDIISEQRFIIEQLEHYIHGDRG